MNSINYILVGQKIKQLRSQRNLTQENLAELCNISVSYLGHIERGTRKLSLETAFKIANCLNVSLDSLILDGIVLNENILSHIESIVKKQDDSKRDRFFRTIKVLAENIDKL